MCKDNDGHLQGIPLPARQPKEVQSKLSSIGPIDDAMMCPVNTRIAFMERTQPFRNSIDEPGVLNDHHIFFMGLLPMDGMRRSIRPPTAAT